MRHLIAMAACGVILCMGGCISKEKAGKRVPMPPGQGAQTQPEQDAQTQPARDAQTQPEQKASGGLKDMEKEGLASLDSARVLWVYDAGTSVVQGPEGKVYLDKVAKGGRKEDGTGKGRAEFDFPALRPAVERAQGWTGNGTLNGIAPDGTAWYLTNAGGKTLALYASRNEVVGRLPFPGKNSRRRDLGRRASRRRGGTEVECLSNKTIG